MKRPTAEEVKRHMKPVVRFNLGRNWVVDAVELKDGTLIVEYIYVSKFRTNFGYHKQRRLAVFAEFDRGPRTNIILETSYVDKLPPRRKRERK